MRFVDGEQRDIATLEQGEGAILHQSFRCDVDEVQCAGDELALDGLLLGKRLARIQERGCYAGFLECVHLILHQGDQWRYDDAGAVPNKSRDLVA